jgi:plastocyanin
MGVKFIICSHLRQEKKEKKIMKALMFISALTILIYSTSVSVTQTIINSGFSFSPSTLSINLGDTVKFVLGTTHNSREVDLATWNVGGTTSNGGFETPFGGGTVLITQVGTHYYVCVTHASFGMKGEIIVNSSTDVRRLNNNYPSSSHLEQNFPNPFNPTTVINFGLKENSIVSLKIYNTLGQQVATLLDNETVDAGNKSVEFDASKLSSGVYFYRLSVEGISQSADLNTSSYTEQRKMILLK